MTDIPADLRYSKDHLWVRPGDGVGLVRVGVTDFAQQLAALMNAGADRMICV